MSHANIASRAGMLVAVTALTAGGLLTVAAPVQAAPCDNWEFPGSFVVNQPGYRNEISGITGTAGRSGAATSFNNSQQVTDTGPVRYEVNGDRVQLTIDWNSGAVGRYDGTVGGGGSVAGLGRNLVRNPEVTVEWNGTGMVCIRNAAPPAPAPAPVPAPAPTPAAPTATVTSDVDHYPEPNGGGEVIGILRVGQVLKVVAPCPAEDWCNFTDGTSAYGSFFKNN